ncbi:MAG: hypothetical protein OQJ84_06725, partial [Xanthomonadales bacterium]|nr:hypothetical protein [Xanthomonadales bacterium]
MGGVAPDIGSEAYRTASALTPRNQQTLLFPTLVKNVDPDRRLSVLEIGPALPETIEYFSQYKCRLHFAAMYNDPILQMQTGDHTDAELVTHLKRSF